MYKRQDIRVIVIAAEGDVFCAGADLKREKAESNVPQIEGSDDISLLIRHLYKPVICKIQGSVHAGALLMVTNCTHAIAVEEAKFSAPEILRGVWPHMVMAGLFRVMPKRAGLDFCMREDRLLMLRKQKNGGLLMNLYLVINLIKQLKIWPLILQILRQEQCNLD